MNKHPAVAVQKERKKNLDLNTALDFDLLAQSNHCDFLEAGKKSNQASQLFVMGLIRSW